MRYSALFFVLGMLAVKTSLAADCPRHKAPANFTNPKLAWQKTDTGIVVDGFVEFTHPRLGIYQVKHGVDLSQHNLVDYGKLHKCGAQFAFVRLDPRYDAHVTGLQKFDIRTYPYYFFPIPAALRRHAAYSKQTPAMIEANLARFGTIGRDAGLNFLTFAANNEHLRRTLASDASHSIDSMVALDIEEKFVDEEKSTPIERAYYGRYYARAVCSWLQSVREKYPKVLLVLYTTPSLYFDYLDKAFPEDNQCLQGLPVWLARTTPDGGDIIRSSNSVIDKYAQRICLVSGGNRCINHQYSHRGIFGSFGRTVDGSPPHVDLNRFFDTKIVENAVGAQYVRSNAAK